MNIFDIATKLADLLNERVVYFDHKSYDFAEDIPHIFDGEQRINVNGVVFNHNGTLVEIGTDNGSIYVTLDREQYEGNEDFINTCNEMKLIDLFRDVYYETNESWEIGDFEGDFLKVI